VAALLAWRPATGGPDGHRGELDTVLFAGLDAGTSAFGHVGFKKTLQGGLDATGFVAMATLGAGGSRDAGARNAGQISVVGGYQWSLDRIHLSVFVGPDLALGGATPRDTPARLGARVHGELWAHPTPDTLATASVIASTASRSVWARVSGGVRVLDLVYVGPEASYYWEDAYREGRIGLHATGLSVGGVTLRGSLGLSIPDDRKKGLYGGLSGHVKM